MYKMSYQKEVALDVWIRNLAMGDIHLMKNVIRIYGCERSASIREKCSAGQYRVNDRVSFHCRSGHSSV